MNPSTPANEGARSVSPNKIVAVPAVTRRIERRPALERITSNGTIAAAVMVLAAIAAVIVANTEAYYPVKELLEAPLAIQVGAFTGQISLEGFINDFLMAIFFLTVGIELKFELTAGVLANPRQAMMFILAACDGMVAPAAIYAALNWDGAMHGWASSTSSTSTARWYILLGLVLWFCMYNSGVHAMLAGVILAFFLPARSDINLDHVQDWLAARGSELDDIYDPDEHVLGQHEFTRTAKRVERVIHRVTQPLQRMEATIAAPVNFLILPLFAFANAQLRLVGVDMASVLTDPAALGVYFGLVADKPLGILAVTALLVRIGFSPLPEGSNWGQMLCVGVLGGVGFTMCILISGLSFTAGTEQLVAKCAVLAASVTASLLGLILLNVTHALAAKKEH